MSQEFKPFNEMDNGGLLAVVRDWVEGVYRESEPGSPYEQESTCILDALDVYEGRASVQAIIDRRD